MKKKRKNSGCLQLVITLFLILLAVLAIGILLPLVANTVYWKWLLLLIPIAFIALYISLAKEKREGNKKRTDCLEAGKLIFAGYPNEFAEYYQQCMAGKKKKDPIEVLCEFADARAQIQVIDWRGEDNEGEIEEFIEALLKRKVDWPNTSVLRAGSTMDEEEEGEFIVDLFKAIDKDLKKAGQRLLFLGLGDSYEYTVVDAKAFGVIRKMKMSELRGAGDLKY